MIETVEAAAAAIAFRNEVLVGDALERLRDLPAESVHCVVTSPPYWGLRDYGTAQWTGGDPDHDHRGAISRTSPPGTPKQASSRGANDVRSGDCECGAVRIDSQIGLETSHEDYLEAMVAIFRELWRVLRSDGTVWLNVGDTYASGNAGQHQGARGFTDGAKHQAAAVANRIPRTDFRGAPGGIKPKDLIGIPWSLALRLRADGWYLRRDVIWSKPNPMPESVTDRPTSSHEYLFMLTKAERYFYDGEAVKEPNTSSESDLRKMRQQRERMGGKNKALIDPLQKASSATNIGRKRGVGSPDGRQRRSVWEIATEPNKEEHFAAFPRGLVRLCILASTSERGVCASCGAPWARVIERYQVEGQQERPPRGVGGRQDGFQGPPDDYQTATRTVGWRPTCGHFDDFYRALPRTRDLERRRRQDVLGSWWDRARVRPGLESWPAERSLVLDPFFGIGTTGLVALNLQPRRDFVGVELNPKYAKIAERRLERHKLQGVLF